MLTTPLRPTPVPPPAADNATPAPVLAVRLRPSSETPALGRHLIRRTLERSACLRRPELAELRSFEDLTTHVAGALVAGSVQQARSPLTLRLILLDEAALIEVEDSCTDFPSLQAGRSSAPARHFVEQAMRTSSAWGYRRLPAGRQLWARVDAFPPPRVSGP